MAMNWDKMREPVFSPMQVAAISGVDVLAQRDWRRRKFLDLIGTLGENGRWTYSCRDVLVLYLMRRLADRGFQIDHARNVSFAIYQTVAEMARAALEDEDPRPKGVKRFVTITYDPKLDDGNSTASGWTASPVDGIDGSLPLAMDAFQIVDCASLAYRMPNALVESLRECLGGEA